MTVKSLKLRGVVTVALNGAKTFTGKLYDGTPFTINVNQIDYEINESFMPEKLTVEGWLYVVQEAQQADRCYLTLPHPSIVYGKQVLVNELDLMPRNASIADFNPKTTGGNIKQMQLKSGEVVEIDTEAFVAESIEKFEAKQKKVAKQGSKN